MSLVAGDLIERARLIAHPWGFTAQVSRAQLLSHLTNMDMSISREVHQIMPGLLSTSDANLTIDQTQNAEGYDLLPAMGYTKFIYKDTEDDKEYEVKVLTEFDSAHPADYPSAWVARGAGDFFTFLPLDPDRKGWTDNSVERAYWKTGDVLKYRYSPLPQRLTKLTDELRSPDFSSDYIIQSAVTLLLQLAGAPASDLELSITKEQRYGTSYRMQLYKFNQIHTPNHEFGARGAGSTSLDVITR